ncbi:hypothetical protein [Terasakiella brassicae]|nr:hypothetical protein [Terasakiella brassicae]
MIEVSDIDYTQPAKLFSFAIHISGTSKSRIATFRDNQLNVSFLALDAITDNARNIIITYADETGMCICLDCDVSIYARRYDEAVDFLTKPYFVEIEGDGGTISLADVIVEIIPDDDPENCEVTLFRKLKNLEQIAV